MLLVLVDDAAACLTPLPDRVELGLGMTSGD
jgi:hypothetical protein